MNRILYILFLAAMIMSGCKGPDAGFHGNTGASEGSEVFETLPVTGTFLNLAYQDVRNKYTNPPYIDGTDPQMWATKVAEMKEMGME